MGVGGGWSPLPSEGKVPPRMPPLLIPVRTVSYIGYPRPTLFFARTLIWINQTLIEIYTSTIGNSITTIKLTTYSLPGDNPVILYWSVPAFTRANSTSGTLFPQPICNANFPAQPIIIVIIIYYIQGAKKRGVFTVNNTQRKKNEKKWYIINKNTERQSI